MKFVILGLAPLILPLSLSAQTLVDLAFDNPVEGTNTTGTGPTGAAYTGTTYRFLNVAPGYDMRASVTSFGNGQFMYSYPNYSSAAGEPSGDLGYRYQATGSYGLGGIRYRMDFFESGGAFSVAKVLPDLALMIYDVDGESTQSESVRVFLSDGFYGYRMPTGTGGTSYLNEGASFLFTGPGSNRNEDDPSGAFILYFGNTSSLVLEMLSNTTGGTLPNGVFSAIDGNLSLIGKSFTNFTDIQAVPEPSMGSLVMVGSVWVLSRRRSRPIPNS